MRRLFNFFIGDSGDERDERYELPNNVVTLPIKAYPTRSEDNEYYHDPEDSFDELLSEDSDAAIARKDVLYRSCNHETRRWIDYIVTCVKETYNDEPHEMITQVYKTFIEAYPTPDSINYDALEYIRANTDHDQRVSKHGHFKSVFYSSLITMQDFRPVSALCVPNLPGVYLVNIKHDYVYGRAIECAMLTRGRVIDETITKRANELFQVRKKNIRPCIKDHLKSEKLCPSEWVLYVNTTNAFYTYCTDQLKHKNPMIDHNLTAGYVDVERLSFYLVLFLCGELLEPEKEYAQAGFLETGTSSAYYADINKWKKLPIWFLDIWYSGNPY